MVELAEIDYGSRVLDLGCGRGAILFPAAKKVRPLGKVIGVDLAEEMVRWTGHKIEQLGLNNSNVLQMDAESPTFPDAFSHWFFLLSKTIDANVNTKSKHNRGNNFCQVSPAIILNCDIEYSILLERQREQILDAAWRSLDCYKPQMLDLRRRR